MSEETIDSSPDVYVRQLREIFAACDSSGSGLLNRDDLQRLCRRLNLEADVSKRITDSLGMVADDRRCVGFDQFKETFVNVLTETEQTDDGNQTSSGQKGSGGTENIIDLSEEEKHLLGIWKELGIGADGHLNLNELHQVIQFLNMGHMTSRDVQQLFTKLDVDGDGFLSFNELLHGLFEIGEISHPAHLPAQPTALYPAVKNPFSPSFETQSTHSLHTHEGILGFLNKEGSGFADSETIVNLWESLGIREGHLILKLMRIDVKKPINLLDLSLALVEEIHSTEVDNNILYHAALTTIEHALDHFHSVNEELKLERDRLVSDLSALKSRNAVIVQEFDEFCSSAEAQKMHEQRLAAEENQAKYRKVLTQLNQESEDCTRLQSQLDAAKQEVASLVGKLDHTNKAKEALELELFQLSEKCCGLEKELEHKKVDQSLVLSLQQQVKDLELSLAVANSNMTSSSVDKEIIDRLELEKKELRDRLDEQTIRLNDLMHRLNGERRTTTSEERKQIMPLDSEEFKDDVLIRDRYEMKLQNLMRGISVERKDIEGVFRLEIADLEQRHAEQLSALRKEFEKEKEELISGHKRHLAEAVAERERDLLTEFSKETAEHFADSADIKELEERLWLAQETAKEKSQYAKALETKLSEMQEVWVPEKSDKKRADAVKKPHEELRSSDERLMEIFTQEKQQMLDRFQKDLAVVREQHERDLAQLSSDLTQSFCLEREKVEASLVDERRKLEQKITLLENDLKMKDFETERYKKELEEALKKKDFKTERRKEELEEALKKRDLETERRKEELEEALKKKDLEAERRKEELEEALKKKDLEAERHKKELEEALKKKDLETERHKKELEEALKKKDFDTERHKKELEEALKKKDLETERRKEELEEALKKKDLEAERHKKELAELYMKDLERELYTRQLEQDLKKKEKEKELLLKELDEEINKKDFERALLLKELEKELQNGKEERHFFKSEIEKLKRVEKAEFPKKLGEKNGESGDGNLRLQVDELCRSNVRLKDELEKREGELLRLKQELEHSHQLKHEHQVDVKDVLMEKDLLKKQLQLTVRQLAEATSALSLTSRELNKEKELAKTCLAQMVDRAKYEDLLARLHDAEAKAHRLQHDCDFRAAETSKLLSLSQTVNKQKLSHLTKENEKLQKQLKQRTVLTNDQMTKITKQAEELVKTDALIRDLYIENAHLVRCLQMTEGYRQDSDSKVQVLHEKCLALGRLLHTVGPAAFSHK